MDAEILKNAQLLWDYLVLHQPPEKADVIVGFGCYNEDIPRRAAELYHQGYAPKILFTGGLGRNTRQMWTRSEASRFAAIALELGVPDRDILVEDKSTNTAENIRFTRALLEEKGIPVHRVLGVHKPYMERRIAAAWPVYWPDMPFSVTSWPETMEEYIQKNEARGRSPRATVEMLVGDFQRISVYARLGYQIPQTIPTDAAKAYQALIQAGYTAQTIPGEKI